MREIMSSVPKHDMYVEVFSGTNPQLFNKWAGTAELYNDTNGKVKVLFEVFRRDGEAFMNYVRGSEKKENGYKVERWDELKELMNRFLEGSVRGDIRTVSGFQDLSRDLKEEFRSWDEDIERIIKRLRLVQIENKRFDDSLERFDAKSTVFYVDVTDLPEDVTHEEVAYRLLRVSGKCVLYGAESDAYGILIDEGWKKKEGYWLNFK